MNKSAFPIRFLGMIGVVALLILLVVGPASAYSMVFQTTPEPEPRETVTVQPSPTNTHTPTVTPSPTPVPYIMISPTEAYAYRAVSIIVSGFQWPTAGQGVSLYWDIFSADYGLSGLIPVDGGGNFSVQVLVRKAWATLGEHKIIAANEFGVTAEAHITLVEPPPEPPTNTPTTPTATTTPTPSATLRPVTPMMTITPIPPTTEPPAAATKAPAPTHTSSPIPGTATPTPTATNTPTPTETLTPTETVGPGTPLATPEPTSTPTYTPTPSPTPVEEISDTGVGWGTFFLWGFVLAGLLVVFRLLRVKGLHEPG